MIDIAAKYRKVFAAELIKLKLSDTVTGYAIDGPAYVPSPQGITVGWMMMISLKHNVLIGQEDVAVTVPLMGILPSDDVIRQGAKYILEEARRLRHEASQAPTPEQIAQRDQMMEQAVKQAAAAAGGSPVPGGLIPGR